VIPGKQYSPEDILHAAWRRRWFIVVPFVLISALSVVIAEVLPDRYRSQTLLQVTPQQVPEKYVNPSVTTRLDNRLTSMTQMILSRTQLERIIQEFNLYPKDRQHMIMEDVVEQMRRRDIPISGKNGGRIEGDSFTVGFEADNPKTARDVADRLAGLFIRENLEDRSAVAAQTDQFLQSQLEADRRQLKDYELKLEQFRRANPGRMPGEAATTTSALTAAQNQLQAVQDSINRDRDRQLMLQRMIADANALAAAPKPTPPNDGTPQQPSTAKLLDMARAGLRNLEAHLTPEHPDIKNQKRLIRDLEQKLAAESLQQPVTASVPAPEVQRVADMQAEFDLLDHRIATKQDDEKKILEAISQYRRQLESLPGVESHLTELMRDYTTLQSTYQNLLLKSEDAKMAQNLERRQIGEQFKIVDPAALPQKPYSPDRFKIMLFGSLAALLLGLAVAGLLEYLDKSLRTEEDVVTALALPVLALVPTMITKAERQRIRRKQLLLATSGAALVVCSAVVITWKFQAIADWIR
jgi:polysaccharide chain length determinant protein (PEP-CTERM system associated)